MKSLQFMPYYSFLLVIITSCLHKEPEQGAPGSSALVFRLQYMVEKNSVTGISDTIYPLSKSDSLTLILTNRLRAYLGDEERLNMNAGVDGHLSIYPRELSCPNQAGAYYNVIGNCDSLIFDFRSGGAIVWEMPLWGSNSQIDQCNSYGWFHVENVEY